MIHPLYALGMVARKSMWNRKLFICIGFTCIYSEYILIKIIIKRSKQQVSLVGPYHQQRGFTFNGNGYQGGCVTRLFWKGAHFFERSIQGKEIDFSQVISHQFSIFIKQSASLHANMSTFHKHTGVVGWCEGAVYLTSLGRPTDIGLQLGKTCYPCSG